MGQEFLVMELGDVQALRSLVLKVGSIFRMTLLPEDGVIPKNLGDVDRTKYFVVLGVDDDSILVGSVLINSRINDRLFNIIGPYQHRIIQEDYDFLTKAESYIDCYRIKEIGLDSILSDAEYIGVLEEADVADVMSLAVSSPANRKLVLKKYHLVK